MPRDKDLKRLVRTRMKKTGEAYTTARAQLIKKPKKQIKADYAALAGMSDDVVKEKTGCTWDRWVRSLDYYGADELSHRDIAKLVSEKYKVGDWWSQMVTVGYERIKGLRARGQRRDGSYEANKSRTFSVPVATLFDAWENARTRNKWLDTKVKIRTATSPKSMRIGLPDGSIIAVGFASKGSSKSSVALAHTKLADRAAVEQMKTYWSERLDALGELLGNR